MGYDLDELYPDPKPDKDNPEFADYVRDGDFDFGAVPKVIRHPLKTEFGVQYFSMPCRVTFYGGEEEDVHDGEWFFAPENHRRNHLIVRIGNREGRYFRYDDPDYEQWDLASVNDIETPTDSNESKGTQNV